MKSLRQSSEGSRSRYDLTVPPVVRFADGQLPKVRSVESGSTSGAWLIVGENRSGA